MSSENENKTPRIHNNDNNVKTQYVKSKKVQVDMSNVKNRPIIEIPVRPIEDMSVRINNKAAPHKGMYILTNFGTKTKSMPIEILIDCGSTMSLLDKTLYDQLPADFKPMLRPSEHKLKFADGSVQQCAGIVTIPLKLGTNYTEIDFIVGNFSDQAILGMVDLQMLEIKIDFEQLSVKTNTYWIPIHDVKHTPIARKVVVNKSFVLPPHTQTIVSGIVKERSIQCKARGDMPVMLEASHSVMAKQHVIPAKSIHYVDSNEIPVMLYNPTDDTVVLEPDTVIGVLVGIDEVLGEVNEKDFETKINSVNTDTEDIKVSSCSHTDTDTKTEFDQSKSTTKLKLDTSGLPDHLVDLFERSSQCLDSNQIEQLKQFLIRNESVFSKSDYDIGLTPVTKHHIDTGDAIPVRQPPRRLNPEQRKAVDEIIKDLLEKKLIEPSNSPWASPICLVKKKDLSWRMCIDYRAVNKLVRKDYYPLPQSSNSAKAS